MSRIGSSLLAAVFFLSGCATFSTNNSDYNWMDRKAALNGFKKMYLSAPPFILTAFQKVNGTSDVMVVYIEGDGYAWASRTRPSDDPTPKHPLAFELASQDPSAKVVYLARPGQFMDGGRPAIDRSYWTGKIYGQEVIRSTGMALDSLKRLLGASKISLVGYSGGAAVAVLVAARRDDIVALRTVAGNLAPGIFARLHHISPLKGSLDPLAVASSVRSIAQLHFVGESDTIVPKSIAGVFLDREGDRSHESLFEVNGVGHLDGWAGRWKELLNKLLYRFG
jgi:hypothetical protein